MGWKDLLGFLSIRRRNRKVINHTAEVSGIISPGGLGIMASVGNHKSEKLDFFGDETVTFTEIPGQTLMFKECGHQGARAFKFNIWGSINGFELNGEQIKREKGVDTSETLCPKCYFEKIKSATIRCCLCGSAILPGQGVALYHKNSRGINKKVATFVNDNAVGCLLWDCCPSGGFFAGHWTFDGFKSAFNDGQTAVEKAFATGKAVVVNIE